MILKLEYGRLIPSIMNKNWYVCQVTPQELHYSNQEHYFQCQSDLRGENKKNKQIDSNPVIPSDSNPAMLPSNSNPVIPSDLNPDSNPAIPSDSNPIIPSDSNSAIPSDSNSAIPSDSNPSINQDVSDSVVTTDSVVTSESNVKEMDIMKQRMVTYAEILKEYPYPRAITILSPQGKYKVIDGYHRLVGCPEEKNPLIIYCLQD
jgi:hypothetical protein